MQEHRARRTRKGRLEIMDGGEDRLSFTVELGEEGHQFQLAADVEGGGGFVQEQDRSFLGQGRARKTRRRSPPERVGSVASAETR